MDRLQEMKDYMKQNQLKKVLIGGYSKEDVNMKFEMLAAMLDNYVKEQTEKEKVMLEEFENKLQAEQAELRRTIDELTAENEKMVQDQFKIKEAYKTYCSELTKRYSESLDTLSEEFSKVMDNVSMAQKSISDESIVEGLEKALSVFEKCDCN